MSLSILIQMQEALAVKANTSAVEGLLGRLEEQRGRLQDDVAGQISKLRGELRSKVSVPEVSVRRLPIEEPVGRISSLELHFGSSPFPPLQPPPACTKASCCFLAPDARGPGWEGQRVSC